MEWAGEVMDWLVASAACVVGCAAVLAAPEVLAAEPTQVPPAGEASVPAPKDVDLAPSQKTPLGIRVDDRERFAEAKRLLESGAATAAYDAARPLFDAYPDNVSVQSLRCRIASVRLVDKDVVFNECVAYAGLTVRAQAAPVPAERVEPHLPSAPRPAPVAVGAAGAGALDDTGSLPRSLVGYAGLGMSYPTHGGYGSGAGLYAEGDYVIEANRWAVPKGYAGLLLTFPGSGACDEGGSPCDVSAKMIFVGGKFRLTAPIPYVAPSSSWASACPSAS